MTHNEPAYQCGAGKDHENLRPIGVASSHLTPDGRRRANALNCRGIVGVRNLGPLERAFEPEICITDGKLIYAGRVGTGMTDKVLADLRRRLEPLARASMPLSAPPPRNTRFGSPLVLSRVHWVEPQLVAEITYLTWTGDELLRQTVYIGHRSDKPPTQVRREVPREGP